MPSSDLKSAKLNLWKESIDSTLSMIFSVSLDILHISILVRLLTQEDVGIFFFTYALVYLFIQVTSGYGKAIRKRASEQNTGRSEYLWSGIIVTIPTLAFIFIIFLFFQPIINSYSSVYLSNMTVFSMYMAVIGYGILEISRYYLAGCNRPGFAEKIRATVAKISMITVTLISLWFYPTVEVALLSVAITYGLTGLFLLWVSPHQFTYLKREKILEILRFSKWSLPTSILNDFYHRWDTIVLGFMVGSISLGYYESSLRIAFLSAVLGVGLSKSANVKISGLNETGKEILPLSRRLIISSTFLVMPMLLIIIFNSEYILSTIYGVEYKGAKWYLIGVTVTQIFQCYRMQFESIFNGMNKPKQTTKTSGVSVFINILTAPILVILFGGLGVIYSTILSELIRIVLYQVQIKNIFDTFITPKGTISQLIIFAIIYFSIKIISDIFILSNLNLLIISSFISIVGFYSLQYILSEETRLIVNEYKKEI